MCCAVTLQQSVQFSFFQRRETIFSLRVCIRQARCFFFLNLILFFSPQGQLFLLPPACEDLVSLIFTSVPTLYHLSALYRLLEMTDYRSLWFGFLAVQRKLTVREARVPFPHHWSHMSKQRRCSSRKKPCWIPSLLLFLKTFICLLIRLCPPRYQFFPLLLSNNGKRHVCHHETQRKTRKHANGLKIFGHLWKCGCNSVVTRASILA